MPLAGQSACAVQEDVRQTSLSGIELVLHLVLQRQLTSFAFVSAEWLESRGERPRWSRSSGRA